MSVQTDNPVASIERRLHARQRLDAIVYLDIGADNGGIVLNLSNEGMGFQAVGYLHKESEVRFRIKLPGTQMRIEVPAEIVWLSDSNRQAGARFLDAQSEGSKQIQEWIRSQTTHCAPWEETAKEEEEVAESPRQQADILDLREGQHPGLMPEFEFPSLSRQKPTEISRIVARLRGPTGPEHPASFSKPAIVAQPLSQPEKLPSEKLPAIQEESPLPTPTSRIAARPIPLPPDAPIRPVKLSASAVEFKTRSALSSLNALLATQAATNRKQVRKRIAIGVLSALCSILCFGIGTWVGRIATHRTLTIPAAARVNVVPAPEPV